jgi:hypothetical protein
MTMANGIKMLRFFDIEIDSLPLANSTHNVLSLEQSLEPIGHRIEQLDRFIEIAKDKCHFPSEHNLTRDESAAIYLYTMNWENDIFYRTIKRDLRSTSQSWLSYLKLFDTAIQKLPNIRVNVWRGMSGDICKKLKKGDEFIWWNHTSCSSTETVIKDSLGPNNISCFIEDVNGKDISIYSYSPNQKEIILCSGTRLRVVSNTRNQTSSTVLHLRECNRQIENSKRVFCFLPHFVVIIIVLLFGIMIGKTQITYKSSSMIDQSSTFYTHVDTLGNRYEGEWFNGKKHGKGKMNFANGCTYTGDWVEDKKSGYGISSLSLGKYEGQFKDDKMHGKGSFYFTDGNTYVGDWINDKQEGEGIFSWANGERYEGGFKEGRLHGQGSYYFLNGNKFAGEWSNGERVIDHGAFTWTNTARNSKEKKTTSENLSENDHQMK